MDFLANILNLKAQEPDNMSKMTPYQAAGQSDPNQQQPQMPDPSTMPAPVAKMLKSAGVTPQQAAQQLMSTTQAPPVSKQDMFNQRLQELVGQQKAGVTSLEDQYNNMKAPTEFNPVVGALAAASDILGNSQNKMLPQLLQSQAQQGQAFDDKKFKYLEQIQKAKGDLSKENIALLGKQIADEKAGNVDQEMRSLKMGLLASGIDRNKSVADFNSTGRQGMFDTNTHDKVVKRIGGDKILGQRVTQYQNLSNALAAVEKADVKPVQQIHELQQAIRKNMGIGGSSGVSERTDTYFNDIGMDKAKFMQYLTGDPQDIAKNHPEMMHHLLEVAKIEMDNVSAQKDKRLKVLTSGYDNALYNRRTDLRSDLDTAAQMAGDQFSNETAGPKVGTIEDGHVFLGGDLSDPKSWKEVGK